MQRLNSIQRHATRRRTLWLSFCWVVLVLSLVGFVRSTFFANDGIQYQSGEFVASPPPGATAPTDRAFRLSSFGAGASDGNLNFFTGYSEMLVKNPDARESLFAPILGISVTSDPRRGRSTSTFWFVWRWPDMVCFLGAGIFCTEGTGFELQSIFIPLWMFAALAAAPLLISWRRRRRFAKRLASGCCTACGYDRAGVPADRACPECGALARSPAAATNT